jgi:hypothetical protein
MALLTMAIKLNVDVPQDIHFDRFDGSSSGEKLNARDAVFGALVDACAMAIGLDGRRSGSLTPNDMVRACLAQGNASEAQSWRTCLAGISPSASFIDCLLNNLRTIYERGQCLRERNNLLVAPPPRKGSRRRWQAVHADLQSQKAWHDQLFTKLTRGEVTEQAYRSELRRRAAFGHPRDGFVSPNIVRFIGEVSWCVVCFGAAQAYNPAALQGGRTDVG